MHDGSSLRQGYGATGARTLAPPKAWSPASSVDSEDQLRCATAREDARPTKAWSAGRFRFVSFTQFACLNGRSALAFHTKVRKRSKEFVSTENSEPESDASNPRLREPVSLPPVDPETRHALETTGRLPVADYRYQMSDLLALAIHSSASDLHLRAGEPPLYRVDGRLIRADGPPIRSNDVFDLIQAFTPEDVIRIVREVGQADFGFAFERQRFRVNVFRAEGEWGAVLRRIPENVPTLQSLLAPPVFYGLARLPRGLVLVTGPTGCGKSTTLASMIDYINQTRPCAIITVEEPIEYVYEDNKAVISQREVGIDTSSFEEALRRIVRQNPDVILVGEMRDRESFDVALTASETGHLVFSTVHTTSAVETLDRIVNMFPPSDKPQISLRLASSLRAILSQKLIPTLDKSRLVPAVEIMVCTPTVSKYIEEGRFGHIYQLMSEGSFWGMQTMNQSLYKLYKEGYISEEETLANAGVLSEMRQILRRG